MVHTLKLARLLMKCYGFNLVGGTSQDNDCVRSEASCVETKWGRQQNLIQNNGILLQTNDMLQEQVYTSP